MHDVVVAFCPDMTVLGDSSFPREYSSMDEAICDVKRMLNFSNHDHDLLLRPYVEDRCLRIGDGDMIVLDDDTNYVRLSLKPRALEDWLV
jgi:hypothetical protein